MASFGSVSYTHLDVYKRQLEGNLGVENYLHEAALASAPPSGAAYRDGAGNPVESLGVHEHWNNSVERLYSRDRGESEGIELVRIPVSYTHLLGPRVYSSRPNSFSSDDSWRESVGWVMCRAFAAFEMLPSRATARKYSKVLSSTTPSCRSFNKAIQNRYEEQFIIGIFHSASPVLVSAAERNRATQGERGAYVPARQKPEAT